MLVKGLGLWAGLSHRDQSKINNNYVLIILIYIYINSCDAEMQLINSTLAVVAAKA